MKRHWRHGELLFSQLCTAGGAVCNESHDDQHGWDHIVEIEPKPSNYLPHDLQAGLLRSLVQVKTTSGAKAQCRIKLSNALKAIKTDLPCFLFLFQYSKGTNKPEIFARHIWAVEIERFLKRARKADSEGQEDLTKIFVAVTFTELDRVGEGVAEWMSLQIKDVGPGYAEQKRKIQSASGYDEGFTRGTMTFGPHIQLEDIIDHELGLNPDPLPLEAVQMFDHRFGMRSSKPIIDFEVGSVVITPKGREAVLVFETEEREQLAVGVEVHMPSFIKPGEKNFKASIRNRYIQISTDLVSTDTNITINLDPENQMNLKEFAEFYQILSWMSCGIISLELRSENGVLFSGKMNESFPKSASIDRSNRIVKFISSHFSDKQAESIELRSREIQIICSEQENIEIMLSGAEFSLGYEIGDLELPELYFMSYYTGKIEEWVFAGLCRFKSTKHAIEDKVCETHFEIDEIRDRCAFKQDIESLRTEKADKVQAAMKNFKGAIIGFSNASLNDLIAAHSNQEA